RRDEARGACDPEGQPCLRERAGGHGEVPRAARLHAELRVCAAGGEGAALRALARFQHRRLGALHRAAPAGGRLHQVQSEDNPRQRHRLALPERAEKGVEGMTNRREFVGASAAAGALAYLPGALAAEPPPETNRIRIPRIPNICWAPTYIAEDLFKSEGITEVRFAQYPD